MEDKIFIQLKKYLPETKKNILLRNHTTFQIGGPAEYFLTVSSREDILKTLKVAKELKLPVFLLGGGSNLLISEKGIRGLVVKIQESEVIFIKPNMISAGAGTEMEKLVNFSVSKSLQGLEWAGGLPGTLGGAIRGNAGAFGGEIKDSIYYVKAIDQKLNLRKFSRQQCQFSYRDSIFKKKNWIVLSAKIKLKKGDRKILKKIVSSRISYRKERHPLEYPNVGSIFKNVDFRKFSGSIRKKVFGAVKKDPFPVVPTAYLIAQAGIKGVRIGKAEISEKHPNFIVNLGGAKTSDVLALADLARNKVKKKFRVNLEMEVQTVGD